LTKINFYVILGLQLGDEKMRVLVKIHRSPEHKFLINVKSQRLICEVNRLIERGRHSRALATVLSKGEVLKIMRESDLSDLKADLILTESCAYRSLI